MPAANALASFASGNNGTFSIGGNLNNAGIVNLAAASGRIGNVLNVAGNYTGTNGQVVLNTLLNEGGAASQSDKLVVGGNVNGTTAIKLNQSGSGAQTVGDGIQLVQVNGTSAANSFHLAGPVQAGAFQYMLFQGGATDANDWYLRSQLAAQIAPGDTSDPTAPPPASAAARGPVAYRPAVVGYSVTPLLNADYGFSLLGRLHERVGDIPNADSTQPVHTNGVWGRIGGQNLNADANDRFSADEHTFFAQFGKDWTLSHDASGGSTHAGATLAFGSTSAKFRDSARNILATSDSTGSVETQAQSIGSYWTRYLPDGSYFDGVGQLTHYQNRYGDIFGDSGSQNGFGAGVSGEIGKPFALGSTGVAIEPQAQLLYQYLHLNSFDDGVSPISSNTTNGLRGRLGFRLFKASLSNDSKTSSVTPYFTADVLHDFFSPGQTTVGGTSFDNELEKTWYDIGIGITGSVGKHSEAYANVKYEHSWGGAYRRNVFGQAGYRLSW
ncbi:autotransporter family protein [Paraburkholderia strydomiana]